MAWDTQRKSKFIDKQIFSKSFYGSDILSETYPPLSPIPKHLEFTQLHLPPPLPVARDVIHGWAHTLYVFI